MSKAAKKFTAHSPGPWHYQGSHVDDKHGLPLVKTARAFEDLNCYDLRLIAKAPELLEILEELLVALDSVMPDDTRDQLTNLLCDAENLTNEARGCL